DAAGQPGTLQIRLAAPATKGERAGLGACTGDSGAPVYREVGGALAVIGGVSWSTGPALSEGCGGLTGVTPLARYRAWLVEQAGRIGSPLAPQPPPLPSRILRLQSSFTKKLVSAWEFVSRGPCARGPAECAPCSVVAA